MTQKLYRRGKVAKLLNVPEPTIKYYTSIGLFQPAGKTPHGQYLYDFDEISKKYSKIKELKHKRLTISEIKNWLLLEGL